MATMTAPTLWIEITIAGAVYLIGISFLLFAGFGIADPRTLLPPEHFFPYLSAGVVAASYGIGVVAHRVVQKVKCFIFERGKQANAMEWYRDSITIWQFGSQRTNRELDFQYGLVTLFRSLVCSIPFLGFSAIAWMARTGKPGAYSVIVLVIALWAPCFAAYRWQEINMRGLRDAAITEARRGARKKSSD